MYYTEETEAQGHYVNTYLHRSLFVSSPALRLQILFSLAAVNLLHRADERWPGHGVKHPTCPLIFPLKTP